MDDLVFAATSRVSAAELAGARLGVRFGRLDLMSQLAVLAVDSLGVRFETMPRDRIGICLVARAGSLSTDVEYWQGRNATGGPSPTLFAYTLPSSAIGEIAIRFGLTGPNLCFVGTKSPLAEAGDLIRGGEADACVCVCCAAVTLPAAELILEEPEATASALFLTRSGTAGS